MKVGTLFIGCVVFMLAFLFFGGIPPSGAVNYTITNVSNNGYDDGAYQINVLGQMVWEGNDGHDKEIYYWDSRVGGAPKNISNNNYDDSMSKLNDQGQVAWLGYDGHDQEIYYWDSRVGGAPKNISNNSYNDSNYQMNAQGQVAWLGYDGYDKMIYYWDPQVGSDAQLIYNNYSGNILKINNLGQVYWAQKIDYDSDFYRYGNDIYYWDSRLGGIAKNISSIRQAEIDFKINNHGQVVWVGYYDIYYWDTMIGGTPKNITNNSGSIDDYNPQIDDQGQVIWEAHDFINHRLDIGFWDARKKGTAKYIANNNFYFNLNPKINAQGQVIWSGYSLALREPDIYYWDSGIGSTPLNISHNTYSDESYRINDNGQVVWLQVNRKYPIKINSTNYYNSDIYYWDAKKRAEPLKINNEANVYANIMINNRSKIIFSGYDGHDFEIFFAPPDAYSFYQYTFRYNYANGDYYTGSVYADVLKDYYIGKKWGQQDEHGLLGSYEITGIIAGSEDAEKNGQVFVDRYYDSESKKLILPVHQGQAVGNDFLGSELDYIIREGVEPYQFGKGYYEADVGDQYTYRYYYGNGDFYQGVVYRQPISIYYSGWKQDTKNETGNTGYYQILFMRYTGDKAKYGQVFVNYYHDGESNKNFYPVHKDQALGKSYLGSEQDYIIKDGVSSYLFGRGYYEANVGDKYLFRYTYGDGDYYQGYVYRAPSMVYYPGYKLAKKNENFLTGEYEILSMTYTGDTSKYGKVYVDLYKDGESDRPYVPLKKSQAVGTSFLGSEQDYIIKDGVSSYLFGRGYYEADVGDRYLFRYTYKNGDYYQGYLFRSPDSLYYPGYKLAKQNETGLPGQYEILSMSYTNDVVKYGLTYVDLYKDGESGRSYAPLKKGQAVGTARLGSEQDYIIKDGVSSYLFGRGYYEADVGDKYLFRYYYSNGDYYQGSVYRAPSATGYYQGQKIDKKNELGLNGYYQILSASWTGETAKYGQVYVDYYKDGESGKGFVPLKKGTAVGKAYLGSESDYIVKDGVAVYRFGQGYYEADVGDRYTFKYTYGNGDYYLGSVYRAPGVGYYPGWKTSPSINETGKVGYYEILAMYYTGDTAKYNQVFVTKYYDGDRTSPKAFTWVSSTNPLGARMGAALLGSEAGYITTGTIAKHYFGKGYYEADE